MQEIADLRACDLQPFQLTTPLQVRLFREREERTLYCPLWRRTAAVRACFLERAGFGSALKLASSPEITVADL